MGTPNMISEIRKEKLKLLDRFAFGSTFAEFGCGHGDYFLSLLPFFDNAIGIDLDPHALNVLKSRQEKMSSLEVNVKLIQADIRELNLYDSMVDFAFSFSTLYIVPEFPRAIRQIHRVLKPGGIAILDLANRTSLNHVVCAHAPLTPPVYGASEEDYSALLKEIGFDTILIRRLQILPYWGNRPFWIWPLLGPIWRKLMAQQVKGRTLDEWLCNLPLLRHFAFRFIFVVRKTS